MTLEYMEDKNPAWRKNCEAAVKGFLDCIYSTQRNGTDYEALSTRYMQGDRDRTRDILTWRKKGGMAPKTFKVYLSGVKELLERDGFRFDRDQLKKITAAFKGGEEAPVDAPDHQKIRSFLEHADVRMKAVTLLLSSSGMRMGEMLSIRETSIDFTRRMITLKAADTKTKQGRVVFFSKEAEQALQAWMKARDKYIAANNQKVAMFGTAKETTDDGRIFPYDAISINKAWNKNLKRAGQYQKNDMGFVTFHPHALRQFFSTQLRRNGCPDSVVEVLLGHKMYLQTYTRYSPVELQEQYEGYAAVLQISSLTEVEKKYTVIGKKADEYATKQAEAEKTIAALKAKISEMESSLDSIMVMEGTVAAFESDVKEIMAFIKRNPQVKIPVRHVPKK